MHVLLEAWRWDKSSKGKYVELEKYIVKDIGDVGVCLQLEVGGGTKVTEKWMSGQMERMRTV